MGCCLPSSMFRGRSIAFYPMSLTDISGKVILVTGGNVGLGYATAKGLAIMGAHVIITCRTSEMGEAVSICKKYVVSPFYCTPSKSLVCAYIGCCKDRGRGARGSSWEKTQCGVDAAGAYLTPENKRVCHGF